MKANVLLALKILAVAAILGLVTANAWAADEKGSATGTWKWTRKSPEGEEQEITATLKQDGDKLTGTIASPLGEVEISDGKVKDGQLSFQINVGEAVIKFNGKVTGDRIKGKIERDAGGEKRTLDWDAKRAKEEKK
jgi:hypothetical protein